MKTVTATEAKQSFAGVLDAAAKGPVVIRRHHRDAAVVISMEEYQRLSHLNVAEFQRFCDQVGASAAAKGMNEDVLADLLTRGA